MSNRLGGRTAVVGLGATEFSKESGRSEMSLACEAVAAAIADNKPGDRIGVRYLRGGKPRKAQITLGKRPAQVPGQDPGSGGGGILPQP